MRGRQTKYLLLFICVDWIIRIEIVWIWRVSWHRYISLFLFRGVFECYWTWNLSCETEMGLRVPFLASEKMKPNKNRIPMAISNNILLRPICLVLNRWTTRNQQWKQILCYALTLLHLDRKQANKQTSKQKQTETKNGGLQKKRNHQKKTSRKALPSMMLLGPATHSR